MMIRSRHVALLATVATWLATSAAAHAEVALEHVWTHDAGGAARAEIVAYNRATGRLLVGNGDERCVVELDLRTGRETGRYQVAKLGSPTSVAASGGLVAIAVAAPCKTDPGHVALFASQHRQPLAVVPVGALPDMVTFTPDGRYVLVACEGEPSDDYEIDPEGSVAIIDVTPVWGAGDQGTLTPALPQRERERDQGTLTPGPSPAGRGEVVVARVADFSAFTTPAMRDELRGKTVRLTAPNRHAPDGQATVAQDLEPEYIAVAPDGRTAWVTLQENNALAVVDIAAARVTHLIGLGLKDFSQPGGGMDASDCDSLGDDPRYGIHIRPWPVWGMYQPDSIAAYEADGRVYLVTANEGDHRQYAGFSDVARVGELKLDESLLAADPRLQAADRLGRLKVSRMDGDDDGDGDYDRLLVFGGRSVGIWTAEGWPVYDSGDQLEHYIAAHMPDRFNAGGDSREAIEPRSPEKGPEPEGVVVGRVGEAVYAFVGLERTSAVAVFDVTDPFAARLVDVVRLDRVGPVPNIAPEGLALIPADENPLGEPLLAVACEVSGTTVLFRLRTGR